MLPQMGSVVMVLQETYKDTHAKPSPKGCVSGAGQRTGLGQGIGQRLTWDGAPTGTWV